MYKIKVEKREKGTYEQIEGKELFNKLKEISLNKLSKKKSEEVKKYLNAEGWDYEKYIKTLDDPNISHVDIKEKNYNGDNIREELNKEGDVRFKYFKDYIECSVEPFFLLCPICGSQMEKTTNEHVLRQSHFKILDSMLFNIHLCCNRCNDSGKRLIYNPYFPQGKLKVKSITPCIKGEIGQVSGIKFESDIPGFKLEFEDNKVIIDINDKEEVGTLLDVQRSGIKLGFLLAINNLNRHLKSFYKSYNNSNNDWQKTIGRTLDCFLESYNGEENYWQYQVVKKFCEYLKEEQKKLRDNL